MFYHRLEAVYIDNAEPALISTVREHINHSIDAKGSIKKNRLVTAKTRVTMKEQMIHGYRMLFADTEGAQMIKKYLAKVKGENGITIDENEVWNDVNDAVDYAMTPRYAELQKVLIKT